MVAKPILKWVGGKRGIVDVLKVHMPAAYSAYYEPFVGGGALFMALEPSLNGHRCHISDLNDDLIDTYLAVRDDPEALMNTINDLVDGYSEAQYYDVRRNLREGTIVERAAKFIYLNKTGYNGLVRYNRSGGFNVPWGHKKSLRVSSVYDSDNIYALSKLLHGVDVRCRTYSACRPKAGDFVYLDPPYASNFSTYNAGGFGDDEQRKLADWCRSLDSRGVFFMLSNSDVPLINELYTDFDVHHITAPRAVSCKGDGRKPVQEVLVTNYGTTS